MTQRQLDVLRAVDASLRERGFPPTIREISNLFGFVSSTAARDHLGALERKGFVVRRGFKTSRSLQLTPAGEALLGLREPPDPYRAERSIESLDLGA